MTSRSLGVIGGSGLYGMAELTDLGEKVISTPFVGPSMRLSGNGFGMGLMAGAGRTRSGIFSNGFGGR